MQRSPRSIAAALVVAAALAGLLMWENPGGLESAAAQRLQAGDGLKWYRGNIHTHSLWSDGDDYPEMIAAWYKKRGYDFLCLTDHNILANKEHWIDVLKSAGGEQAYDKLKARFPENWIDERIVEERRQVRLKTFSELADEFDEPGRFLLVQGEEITDRFRNMPVHLNVTNIRELIPPLGGESVYDTMQNNVNAAVAQRERTGVPMLVHLNHPNFHYGITAEDLSRVRGENFFEVYNGHPSVHNSGDAEHASTDRMWDIMLTLRIADLGLPLMYGLATDDGHNYHKIPSRASEPGRGWINVLASELTPETIIPAMEQGRFYASSGVTLQAVESSRQGLAVVVDPEPGVSYTVEFIGTRQGFDPHSEPVRGKEGEELPATRRYSDDIGEVLDRVEGTQAAYEFRGEELYVRARITSSRPHPNPSELGEVERAWVQPVLGPAAPDRN